MFDFLFPTHQARSGLFLAGVLVLLGSCQVPPQNRISPSPTAEQTPAVESSTSPFATAPSPVPLGATVTVQIYEVDETCESLIPAEITVPADQVLEASIASILSRFSPANLSPLAYRITIDSTTGQADLDLQPAPSSSAQRSLQSLSSCEQLALLGSLRETLLSHPEWGIQSVRFTENGEPLLL